MAKCPQCKTEIKPGSPKCSSCGVYFDAYKKVKSEKPKTVKSENTEGEESYIGYKLCGILASLTCFIAGLYMLMIESQGKDSMLELIAHGMGIYFIAKGFFVGPMIFSSLKKK